MKTVFCVVFLFVVVKGLTDEQKVIIMEAAHVCVEKTGITKEIIEKIKTDFDVDDPKRDLFSVCMMNRFGLFDSDGNFHKEIALEIVDVDEKQLLSDVLDGCGKKLGKVTEENAYELCKCAHSLIPKSIYLEI